MKTLEDYQHLFETDLEDLKSKDQSDLEYLEQSHFGDLLIESIEDNDERFKLWRNHDVNIKEGEPTILIEHMGKINGYSWETIATY